MKKQQNKMQQIRWHTKQTGARQRFTSVKGEEERNFHNNNCPNCQIKDASLTATNHCATDFSRFTAFWNEVLCNQDTRKMQGGLCLKTSKHMKIHCNVIKGEGKQSATMLGTDDQNDESRRHLRRFAHKALTCQNDSRSKSVVSREWKDQLGQ